MRGHMDRKRGRFRSDFETNEILNGLSDWQATTGDTVDWYRFESEKTSVGDVYDEGVNQGKVYDVYEAVSVLHVVREEGDNEDSEFGLYYNDNLHVTASIDTLGRVGITDIDLAHNRLLRDRLVYDNRVFRIMGVSVLGQIQRRDIIVSIEATQVKPDELVNDAQFAWAKA